MNSGLLKIKSRSRKLINYPMMAGYYFLSLNPRFFYGSVVKSDYLKQTIFVISFDCDIAEDLLDIEEIVNRLLAINISPVLAIPTEILDSFKDTALKLSNIGIEFLNHGHKIHTARNGNHYYSIYDYEKLSKLDVQKDIFSAHEWFQTNMPNEVTGFRTPHFGNVQDRIKIKFIYNYVRKLGYKYSSSRLPYFLYRDGIKNHKGIIEFPLSGAYNSPLKILDSFNYFDQSTGTFDGENYLNELITLTMSYKSNTKGLINLYVDPSHIKNSEEFWIAMKLLSDNFLNYNYARLIGELDA